MALLYNVSQLLKSDVGQARQYEFESDEPIDLEGDVANNLRGTVRFMLTNFGILARIHADATLHLTCARCLEPFQTPTAVDFEEEYQPLIDIATGLPFQGPRSDTAFTITQNHTIDLTEALRQHLLLAVEIIPVCRDDCRGLCQTCGVNLNLEQCACPPPEVASPFAVLQHLLVEAESEK